MEKQTDSNSYQISPRNSSKVNFTLSSSIKKPKTVNIYIYIYIYIDSTIPHNPSNPTNQETPIPNPLNQTKPLAHKKGPTNRENQIRRAQTTMSKTHSPRTNPGQPKSPNRQIKTQ